MVSSPLRELVQSAPKGRPTRTPPLVAEFLIQNPSLLRPMMIMIYSVQTLTVPGKRVYADKPACGRHKGHIYMGTQ